MLCEEMEGFKDQFCQPTFENPWNCLNLSHTIIRTPLSLICLLPSGFTWPSQRPWHPEKVFLSSNKNKINKKKQNKTYECKHNSKNRTTILCAFCRRMKRLCKASLMETCLWSSIQHEHLNILAVLSTESKISRGLKHGQNSEDFAGVKARKISFS